MPKNLTVARARVLVGKVLFYNFQKRHGVVSQMPFIASYLRFLPPVDLPRKAIKPPSERLGGLYDLIKIYAFNAHHQTQRRITRYKAELLIIAC